MIKKPGVDSTAGIYGRIEVKKKIRFRGIWYGLIGIVVGLALGYFGAGYIGSKDLLGLSNFKIDESKNIDLETMILTIQMERVQDLDDQVQKKMEEIKEKSDNKENTQQDSRRNPCHGIER